MDDLVNAISKRDHYEQALRSLRPNIEDPPEKSQELCGLACLDATPRVVAEQLAQIEMERLAMIGPDEIVEMLSTSSLDNLQQVWVFLAQIITNLFNFSQETNQAN